MEEEKRLLINPKSGAVRENEEERENARLVARAKAKHAHRFEDGAQTLVCVGCGRRLCAATDARWECCECDAECVLCPECGCDPLRRHTHGGVSFWYVQPKGQRWQTKMRLAQRAHFLSCRQFLAEALTEFAPRPFLGQRMGGCWRWWTFHDAAREAHFLEAALRHTAKVLSGQRVVVLAENSVAWALADFACILGLFVSVPIHPSAPPEHIASILESTDAVAAFVSETCAPRLCAALQSLRPSQGSLHDIILLDTQEGEDDDFRLHADSFPSMVRVHKLRDFIRSGAAAAAPFLTCELLGQRMAPRSALVSIVFTSGSGGQAPKGVQFTDADFVEQMAFPLTLKHVVLFGYLPLSHLAGRLDLFTALSNGGRIAFPSLNRGGIAGSSFFSELREVRPTAFGPVPRICSAVREEYESILRGLCSERGGTSAASELKKIARKRLRCAFGDRVSSVKVTSAPVTEKMRRFLRKVLKVAVNEGYGSSEAGSIAHNGRLTTPVMLESVPDLGYSVDSKPPRGLVYVPRRTLRCSSLLGAKGTVSELPDWFCTGDIGEYRDGRLHVIDRRDGVVKLSGGEFLELGRLERLFSQDKGLVRAAFVFADQYKDAPVLLVVPTSVGVSREAVLKMVRCVAEECSLAAHEIPCGVQVLSGDIESWTVSSGLVTDLGKPIRSALLSRYRSVIDATYAAAALARATPSGAGETDWSKTFAELGGDSLAASRVLSDLRAQNVAVPALDTLFRTPLQSLSGIVRNIGEEPEESALVPLEEEKAWFRSELGLLLAHGKKNPPSKPPQKYSAVFITGATGFLGRRLLSEMISVHPAAKFYCICRSSSTSLLPSSQRIVPVVGDLSRPLFGLSQKDFDDLCSVPFDCVVHCAAFVNHLASYPDLRATNVRSLRDVAAVALGLDLRCSPLYVITSSAVYKPQHRIRDGYAASKFVEDSLAQDAEAIAAAAEAGVSWPVFVIRPALIGPDHETGEANERDWLFRLLRAALDLRAVPILDETRLNWVPVDYTARFIAQLTAEQGIGSGRSRVFVIGSVNAGVNSFMDSVHKMTGATRIPFETWHEQLLRLVETSSGKHPASPFAKSWREGFPGIPAQDTRLAEQHVRARQLKHSVTSALEILPFTPATTESIDRSIHHMCTTHS